MHLGWFILSSFFLTNSERLKNRGLFVESLFMHPSHELYNKIGNNHVKENDCTRNRMTFVFLKDIRPFGTMKAGNKCGEYYEFECHEWIELFVREKRKELEHDKNMDCKVGDGDSYLDFGKLKHLLRESQKKVIERFPQSAKHSDSKLFGAMLNHSRRAFDKCHKSSNFDFESTENEQFVKCINRIISWLRRTGTNSCFK